MLLEPVTDSILKAFCTVYNGLGYGFLEKVYQNALQMELCESGFTVQKEQTILVFYKGCVVGEYCADLIVNDVVILELKAAEALREEHAAQLKNYLKATDKEVGLLLNFGKKPEFKRLIFSNTERWKQS